MNLILRNPSAAPGKNPLLQTQGLPEGTRKVINSLSFSQKTFEGRQRITSGVRKTVILNPVNMQVAELPQLPLSRCCLGLEAESLLVLNQLYFPTPLSLAGSSIANKRRLCPFGREAHCPVIRAGITLGGQN